MGKYTTEYFGEITIDETKDYEQFLLMDPNNKICFGISFSSCNTGGKIKKCLNIIDKYFEIKKIAGKIIVRRFIENETFHKYFINTF
jgi:hypothetical protein